MILAAGLAQLPEKLGRSGVAASRAWQGLDHYAPNRHDIGSTTARSVDELALIRDTISHYAPVLIAPLSIQIRRAGVQGGPEFFCSACHSIHLRRLRARSIKVIVYDEEIPLRYRALDFIHLTHDGHAMIAAALLPRVVALLDRRRSDVLPSQSPSRG